MGDHELVNLTQVKRQTGQSWQFHEEWVECGETWILLFSFSGSISKRCLEKEHTISFGKVKFHSNFATGPKPGQNSFHQIILGR